MPTIEEELWKALYKARLIFPTPSPLIKTGDVNWDGCDYSKCGRTDRGVSAFGQVIGIRVRSNRPLELAYRGQIASDSTSHGIQNEDKPLDVVPDVMQSHTFQRSPKPSDLQAEIRCNDTHGFDPINDEIQYVQVLNKLLPSDIRILAWCASPPPDFSARFSCKERRYRYFFTQPAFNPKFGALGLENHIALAERRREGWLDIQTMREAAKKFEGLHDFRNFCKIDASKQFDSFERRIFHADIEEVPGPSLAGFIGLPGFEEYEGSGVDHKRMPTWQHPNGNPSPKIYTFTLHGSGFLWHQVRCMVAILFVIGQGLEPPGLVSKLLDIRNHPQKPTYEMADDAPLVLWDCIFPQNPENPHKDSLEWIYVGDSTRTENGVSQPIMKNKTGKFGYGGVVDELWKVWRQRKMDEVLAGTLLNAIVRQGNGSSLDEQERNETGQMGGPRVNRSQRVYLGGNGPRLVGKYIPVLSKPKMESVAVVNEKYAKRKGSKPKEEAKDAGYGDPMSNVGDNVSR